MKNSIFIITVLISLFLFSNNAVAQDREIEFAHSNFDEILAKAKKENKLIFMDCWATWCRPCIQMANTAFKDNTAADFYNKSFINAKFDMEKGEGIDLKNKYGVNVFPTLLFINGEGEVVHRSAGGRDAAGIIALGELALDPNRRLSYFLDNYEAKKNDGEFVLKYLNALKGAYLPYGDAASNYFLNLEENDYLKEENWSIIKTFVEEYDSKIFQYLDKNKAAFIEKFGKEEVEAKIESVYFSAQAKFLTRNLNEEAYNKNKELILAKGGELAIKAIATADVYFYQIKGDWVNYAKKADVLIMELNYREASRINSFAWTAFEKIEDTNLLKKAIKWAEILVELEESPAYLDTFANLHFKVGNKKKAIEIQEKAIKILKDSGASTEEYEETLKKFQN